MHFFLKRPQEWPTSVWLSLIIVWLTIEMFILGKFSLVVVGDNVSLIPYLLAFHDNQVPLSDWTPYPAGGTDLIATGYSPLIFHWVFSLLPSWLAFQALAISPVLAAVLGTYGLCRRTFDFDRYTGIFAAFIYGAFFSREFFYVSGLGAYLPLIIFCMSLFLDNKSSFWRWAALITVGFLIAHTAYITRLIPWPAASFLIWFLFIERRLSLLDWAIIALFSIAIMATRWMDIASILAYSKFSAISEFRNITDPIDILSSAVNHLQAEFSNCGYVPFIFILGFMWSLIQGQQPKSIRILTAIVAYIGLLFLASLGKIILVHFFPLYSGYNILHIMQGFPLLLVIAGAMAFEHLRNIHPTEGSPASTRAKILTFTPLIVVLYVIYINGLQKLQAAEDWVAWGNYHQNTQNPILKAQAARIRAAGKPTRAMSFHMHGNLLNSYGLESMAGYHPLMSRRYRSFWWKMAEGWHQMPGWKGRFGKSDLGSITSLLPVEVRPEWRFGDFVNLNLLSLANAGLIVSRDKLTDPELQLISGPQRPWSSLTRDEKIKVNLKANFDGKKPLYLYKNPQVLPRAFTLDRLQLFDTDQEVLKALGQASLEELAHTGFINKSDLPPGLDPSAKLGLKTTTVSEYSGDKIVVDFAPSNSPTILLVSNTYSPYWKSSVDDKETQIFPLDHTFWGLMIPANAKQVIFRYKAPYRL
jgi:hypothetical protein